MIDEKAADMFNEMEMAPALNKEKVTTTSVESSGTVNKPAAAVQE